MYGSQLLQQHYRCFYFLTTPEIECKIPLGTYINCNTILLQFIISTLIGIRHIGFTWWDVWQQMKLTWWISHACMWLLFFKRIKRVFLTWVKFNGTLSTDIAIKSVTLEYQYLHALLLLNCFLPVFKLVWCP